MLPTLPILQAERGLPRVIAGLIASSFYGIGAVFGVAGGLLIDRLGARRMILAGAAVIALVSLVGGLGDAGRCCWRTASPRASVSPPSRSPPPS